MHDTLPKEKSLRLSRRDRDQLISMSWGM